MKLAKSIPDIVNCLQKKEPFHIVVLPILQLQSLNRVARGLNLDLLSDALENTSSVTKLDATFESVAFPSIVKSLYTNTSITSVDLSHNQRYNAIAHLSVALQAWNKTIKELILKDCDIDINDMRSLSSALKVNQTLKKLDLSDFFIPQEAIGELGQALKMNKSIEYLAITLNINSNDLLKDLKLNSSLTHLDLSHSNVSSELYELLADNTRIKSLDLTGCTATVDDWNMILMFLYSNDTLTSVNLTSANLTSEHYDIIKEGLKENRTLKSLTLGQKTVQKGSEKCSPLIQALSQALKTNQSLTELKIEQLLISDEAVTLIRELHDNSSLLKLSFVTSMITTPLLVSFREWFNSGGKLEELEMHSSSVESEARYEIKKFAALPFKTLLLSGVAYGEQDFYMGLQDNTTLVNLSVPKCNYGLYTIVPLAKFVNYSKTIRKLDLSGLSPDDGAKLLDLIRPCKLTHITINGSTIIGYERTETTFFSNLGHYLKSNKHIRVMELTSIQANSKFGKEFLENLGDNSTLVDLTTPGDNALLLCPELRERLYNNRLQTLQRAKVNIYVLARNTEIRSAIPFELWLVIFEFVSPSFISIASNIWNDCFRIKKHK